jgi:hypothetical protein
VQKKPIFAEPVNQKWEIGLVIGNCNFHYWQMDRAITYSPRDFQIVPLGAWIPSQGCPLTINRVGTSGPGSNLGLGQNYGKCKNVALSFSQPCVQGEDGAPASCGSGKVS